MQSYDFAVENRQTLLTLYSLPFMKMTLSHKRTRTRINMMLLKNIGMQGMYRGGTEHIWHLWDFLTLNDESVWGTEKVWETEGGGETVIQQWNRDDTKVVCHKNKLH
jgi:hypothetical protein